jgi:hypothetical protein
MNANEDPQLATARRVYWRLTRAYPRLFRQAYGPQMLQVFSDQYRAARAASGRGSLTRFWLRTLGDLVSSAAREQVDQFRSFAMNQEGKGTLLLGMLLFVLLGTAVVLVRAPAPLSSLINIGGTLLWSSYLLVLGLLLKGWLAGFPRWVYAYLGYAILFPLFVSYSATPWLTVFGIPIWGSEPWGWRAFVPLGLVVLLGLIFSRPPWGNLVRLVRNAWEDWTLVAFFLFGLLPFAGFISLEEVDPSFAFWPQLAGVLLILLGAFLYLRLANPGLRYLVLLACAFLAVLIMSGGAGYFWHTHYVNFTTGESYMLADSVDWSPVLLGAFTQAGWAALFLLIPLPLALARLAFNFFSSGKLSLS